MPYPQFVALLAAAQRAEAADLLAQAQAAALPWAKPSEAQGWLRRLARLARPPEAGPAPARSARPEAAARRDDWERLRAFLRARGGAF